MPNKNPKLSFHLSPSGDSRWVNLGQSNLIGYIRSIEGLYVCTDRSYREMESFKKLREARDFFKNLLFSADSKYDSYNFEYRLFTIKD